ncbi:DUF523 domain-containing protein [Aliiroseovarius sp. Z3]|uniref:DUF523 domain-containing protein n=1 Tax=Aliiroseovarius sp. Z3 TaxID=2811402 RepID=UPI0023B2DE64|nr:DUF523 domain-containing protein [Aliiroseovarius sp. Z3]MDE9449468.1 DUF523 domain-containing protein [Aliiroseovarius sp. Z3]
MSRLLVSACLMGQKVRYDGQAKTFLHTCLTRWDADGRVVPFCPELAGGLAVPRLPAEIEPERDGADVLAGRAKVVDSAGVDVTAAFVAGARMAVKMAQTQGCTHALLTEASPSCGSTLLYSGHHDGTRRAGFGVTTAALQAAGLAVYAPHQIDALALDCAW